jgi:hypothetical protein
MPQLTTKTLALLKSAPKQPRKQLAQAALLSLQASETTPGPLHPIVRGAHNRPSPDNRCGGGDGPAPRACARECGLASRQPPSTNCPTRP